MSGRPAKGGVWKNTEDEILKVAVMKYGKNQWARISSLLVRKTPKQCKARWYEWLDPSIKKTEWSREEDEKLLHLAKVMPTQWRTIAPLVGRTTNQCLERYQRLLDDAEAKEGADGETPSADDVRKLRPGEIDPDPENKPARPDPIDMDDDEKEMLSEARARLANTQGKKAKRKARERQLEEARRLAALQKKRELKAAGIDINVKRKRKKGELDFNAEIPFQHRAPVGFFDTSEEKLRHANQHQLHGKLLSQFEGKSKAEQEEIARRNDERKRAENAKKGKDDAANARLEKLAEDNKMTKRARLQLPAPQVGESELEEIVKLGMAGEQARDLVDQEGGAAQQLLTDYTPLNPSANLRTPRTTLAQNNVMQSARDLLALQRTETPLLGGENTPLHQARMESATPRHEVVATPNPLLQHTQGQLRGVPMTPGTVVGQTPLRRDTLNINTPAGMSTVTATPGAFQSLNTQQSARLLDEAFAAMPKAKNDFEVVAPDLEEVDQMKKAKREDASDRDLRLKEAIRRQEEEKLARRSLVLKRVLPRPTTMEKFALSSTSKGDAAALKLIENEMATLILYEQAAFPVQGGPPSAVEEEPAWYSQEAIAEALAVLSEETQKVRREHGVAEDAALLAAFDASRAKQLQNKVFLRSTYADVALKKADEAHYLKELKEDYTTLQDHLLQMGGRNQKQQKKTNLLLGGHMARINGFYQQETVLCQSLKDAETEYHAFASRQAAERQAIPHRLQRLQEEVQSARQIASTAQNEYRHLVQQMQS